MVERDRREHRDVAVRRVGRVPRAAHPDLQDEDVDGRVRGRREGERREELEERQRLLPRGGQLGIDHRHEGLDLVPHIGDDRVGDRLAVDEDALGEPRQVRAREQSGPQAVRAHEPFDDPRRRGLAVRPRHVHDPVGPLRVVEELQQARRALLARLHPALARALEQRLVDGVSAIAIRHQAPSVFVSIVTTIGPCPCRAPVAPVRNTPPDGSPAPAASASASSAASTTIATATRLARDELRRASAARLRAPGRWSIRGRSGR